jgi:hypothetical protein
MSDPVRTISIIAAAIVIALFIFRRRLSSFLFKANKDGLQAELKTHTQEAAGDTSFRLPESARIQ